MELIARDYATRYGWYVFPLKRRDKPPITQHGFKDATTDLAQIAAWWNAHPEANIGLDCGRSGLVVIDLDGIEGIKNWNSIQDRLQNPEHKTAIARTGGGGAHIYYRAPVGVDIRSGNNKLAPHVDVKANGGYVVAPPSIHPSGNKYEWQNYPDEIAPLPDALIKLLTQPDNKLAPTNGNGSGHKSGFTMRDADYSPYVQAAIDGELANLRAAQNGTRNHTLNTAAFKLATLGMSLAELETLLEPVALDIGLTEKEMRATIKSGHAAGAKNPRPIPDPDFVLVGGPYDANGNGNGHGAANATNTTQSPQWMPLNDITDAFKHHEKGDAQLLAQLCAGRIAYDHAAKRWFFFGSPDAPHSWSRDRRAQIIHLVTDEIAAQYLHAAAELKRAGKATDDEIKDYEKRAGALQFKGRVDHVLDLAQSQKALALTGDEWDANAMLLACPNGVIDLRADAFAFRAGQPRDFVRTTAAAEWQGINTPAPRWEQFLNEIFAGSAEVISFMRRWFGYCLTGQTNEDAFVVLHGEGGRNGKRILTETIARVMGEYAMIGDDDLLMDGQDSRAGAPKQFLIDIAGKRLVLMSETKKGARFNLARVKKLSGSDIIAARGMHALEGTQLRPTWKIVLSTNPMPRADSDDSAFFERLAVVEFSQQFVEKPDPQQPHQHKRDANLKAKLDAEASGILAWLVRGCLEWQSQGLNIPDQVRLTTHEYRETQDELADYEQERLVRNPQAKARAGETYADYVKWVGQYADKKAMSSKVFGERMTKRFGKAHDKQGNFYIGVGLVF